MSLFPNDWHANSPGLIDMGLLRNCPAYCDQLDLFILILFSHPGMQNGGEGLPCTILAGQGILVNMLITLEPHGIF